MKLVVVVPDGLADVPQASLDNRTPLQVAITPALDGLAEGGKLGTARTLAPDGPTDTSYALMSILGYGGSAITGRGWYEALDREVELKDGEWVARCQLVTTDGNAVTDPIGGHTSTTEGRQLIALLNEEIGIKGVRFHFGNRDNHLVSATIDFPETCQHLFSPWEVIGKPFSEYMPADDSPVGRLMARTREVLENAEVNRTRRELEENTANLAYIYGAGRPVQYAPLTERCGLTPSALISYSPMARGLATAIGVDRVIRPEASDYPHEELRNLGIEARHLLDSCDLVVVHTSFPDKYAEKRRLLAEAKVQGIERVDEHLIRPLYEALSTRDDARIAVVPTLVSDTGTRKHLADPVPFLVSGAGISASKADGWSEATAAAAGVALEAGSNGLIRQLAEMS